MKSNDRLGNTIRNTLAKRDARSLTLKMTAAQFAELGAWAKEVRTTPEELTVAFAMDALRMRHAGTCSFEEEVATTIYALSTFIDERLSPEEAASK